MAFTINKKLNFVDSMQFMGSSREKLIANLSDNDFKYLSQEFAFEILHLVKQKDAYPYEYMNSSKRFSFKKNYLIKNVFIDL